MKCVLCSSDVVEVEHIAIDDTGDPQILCAECHKKVRIFFEEVRYSDKTQS